MPWDVWLGASGQPRARHGTFAHAVPVLRPLSSPFVVLTLACWLSLRGAFADHLL